MLHDLEIKNFRAFSRLTIERLGRVNLIVGKNGVGKTTLLEAVQLYGSVFPAENAKSILTERDEIEAEAVERAVLILRSIFHGRRATNGTEASIGPVSDRPDSPRLRIKAAVRSPGKGGEQGPFNLNWPPWRKNLAMLEIETGENRWYLGEDEIVWHEGKDLDESFGKISTTRQIVDRPPVLRGKDTNGDNHETARRWDRLALTLGEKRALDVLKIFEPVEAIAFVVNSHNAPDRIAKVRLAGSPEPVPLAVLGDGIVRMFQIAVAMEYAGTPMKDLSVDGLFKAPPNVFPMLLIDEAEVGIHYSLHADLWRFIFKAAKMLGVQVFATTHSWDCIKGFAEALKDAEPEEGLMIRLEKAMGQDRTGAVIIDRDDLPIVVRESIEVR